MIYKNLENKEVPKLQELKGGIVSKKKRGRPILNKTRVVINLNKAAHEFLVREAKKLGISQSLLCEIALKKLVNNPVSIGF